MACDLKIALVDPNRHWLSEEKDWHTHWRMGSWFDGAFIMLAWWFRCGLSLQALFLPSGATAALSASESFSTSTSCPWPSSLLGRKNIDPGLEDLLFHRYSQLRTRRDSSIRSRTIVQTHLSMYIMSPWFSKA